jgi:serine phosphatase RsbU (regulator of sigma subunit)
LSNKLPAVSILLFILVFAGCRSNPGLRHNVTFQVMVKKPTTDQKVFIAGNQPELGDWNPDSVMLDRTDDSTFRKTVSFYGGTDLEFRVTAGSWWLEALDSNEQLYQPFRLNIEKDTICTVVAYDWKNTFVDGKVVLNQRRFKPGRTTMILDNFWKYHPGDDPAWARNDIDDSSWKTVESYYYHEKDSVIGWYRFHFIADTSLWNRSLALHIDQLGASQIYYNGKLLYAFGEIGNSSDSFKPSQVHIWKEWKIAPEREQVIVVRYANFNWKEQEKLGFKPGFAVFLNNINTIFEQVSDNIPEASFHQMIFSLIPFILIFLHIFIFAFNTEQKENLFYALCLLGFAGIIFFDAERFIATDSDFIILCIRLIGLSVPVAIFFGLMTFYAMIYYKLPARWMFYSALFVIISVLNYMLYRKSGLINYVFFGIANADIIISSVSGKIRKKKLKGRVFVFAGFIILALFIVFQILLDYAVVPPVSETNQVFGYGMVGFAVAMSLFLSYNMSQMNKDLQTQLHKVKELSAITLEQERTANKLELEKRLIESENERKTKELEEARKLQLSILPVSFPEIPHLEISANMRTANEVGGDYYDYNLFGDGAITLTIGDATGHGIRAGIMVTLVKSLFGTMGDTYFIPDFFNHCTRIIKKMNLGHLYMGLTILKIEKYKITVSAAGMPPFLIFRQNTNSVEDVVIKGMPLGAFLDFRYEQKILKVSPGDAILLLTDGFLEMMNADREMIDYDSVKKDFIESAVKDPPAIIKDLLRTADNWLDGCQQGDDITFLVIKIR